MKTPRKNPVGRSKLPPLVEKPEGVYQRGCEPKWHRQVSAVNIHTSTGALAQKDM